jgi:hypothetical protein
VAQVNRRDAEVGTFPQRLKPLTRCDLYVGPKGPTPTSLKDFKALEGQAGEVVGHLGVGE